MNKNDNSGPCIIMLQGPPASGKTTWARNFIKENKNYVLVSRDSIRESRGEYWIPEQENYISDIEEFEVRSAIKHKLSPIIDATNLNPKTVEKWKNLAEELNVKIDTVPFKIDFKTAIERDGNRDRPVGKRVLESFFSRYFPEELKKFYTDNRKILEFDISKDACVICDLDGTLCLHQGRSPYDLSKVLEDKPNIPLINTLYVLNQFYPIFFLSGREGTEQCIKDTTSWLEKYYQSSIPDEISRGWKLITRKQNDYRPDEIIKEELYKTYIEPNYNIICIFDDRDKVVKMWRELGLLCTQVYYGNF